MNPSAAPPRVMHSSQRRIAEDLAQKLAKLVPEFSGVCIRTREQAFWKLYAKTHI